MGGVCALVPDDDFTVQGARQRWTLCEREAEEDESNFATSSRKGVQSWLLKGREGEAMGVEYAGAGRMPVVPMESVKASGVERLRRRKERDNLCPIPAPTASELFYYYSEAGVKRSRPVRRGREGQGLVQLLHPLPTRPLHPHTVPSPDRHLALLVDFQ
ncbi:hypothetical protein AAT19DRAFT_10746 [Rhodotorula toruloides]|uniref:Uncharacterized protein n=1 Tax=Rhodotorula toruloides TaxID=5286 RepID=A0A2S9ZZL5_RHOTO|nr:hypothetical protein AAT19DRAFT_10746 [Rhodotorula toruloides]